MYEVKQKLWLTSDKDAVVADGDPRAAFLYACEGHTVPLEEAECYGLDDIAPLEEAEWEKGGQPEENKSSRPAANKSSRPAANKSR